MEVQPITAWNRSRRSTLPQAEPWTRNGLTLDSISFIGGLRDGEAIIEAQPADAAPAPVFHEAMTQQDLVSMIESLYRIRDATSFSIAGSAPVTFLGQSGVQPDCEFVLDDELKRRGHIVIAVADSSLYMISLNATAIHYFDAALPEFDAIARSARILQRIK